MADGFVPSSTGSTVRADAPPGSRATPQPGDPANVATYTSVPFVPGRRGLRWNVGSDQLAPDEALLRINTVQDELGEIKVRLGQTSTITGLGDAHSAARMNLPASSTFMRFWGGGTQWWRGNTQGTLASIDTGYSGDPLTMLQYRPALSGEPWMIAADRSRVRQATATLATPIPLGLTAPAAAVTAALAALYTTSIAAFDNSDSTQAASWTMTAGVDRSVPPNAAGAPVAADVTGVSGNAVEYTTAIGAAVTGYSSIMSIAKTMNLSVLQGGAVPATDQDFVHLWVRTSLPALLEEVRIYLVCSAAFTAGVIPGTSTTQNTDAFVKAIRPSDFTDFIEDLESALAANEAARQTALLTQFVENPPLPPFREGEVPTGSPDYSLPSNVVGSSDLPTQGTAEMAPGRNTWSEFGAVNRPLRRGEFLRIGSSSGRGWNNITGIVIVVQTAAAAAVAVACDDWYLTGGSGLDTTEPTSTAYDWRCTNYHLDTGDESNPSPEMAATAYLEVARAPVTVTPAAAYGSARVRQRFYRRGGTLGDDWYYSGMNSADGGAYADDESDTTIVAAGTLELDNDQPITTVTNAGVTVLAQPTPSIFGPIDGRLFALGDPYRPGHLYYSKAGRSGSWPPGNVVEVCPPSEALQMGTTFGGVGIVLSRERGYLVTPNLVNGDVAVSDSACQVGIVSRWAWVQGVDGVYFVSGDAEFPGVYVTQGQRATLLSEAIDPVFRGVSVVCTPSDTIPPVDWTQSAAIRLGILRNILWLHYVDTGATRRTLCCNLSGVEREWYEHRFAVPPQMSYAEPPQASDPVMWLGAPSGVMYTYSGSTDAGTAITCRVATGYLTPGNARDDKDLGDVVVEANVATGQNLGLITRLNSGLTTNANVNTAATTGRRRYIVDPFGTDPQYARNVQLDFSWPGDPTLPSALYQAGVAVLQLPDHTLKRATTWESFPTEQYLTGVTLVADTAGASLTVLVEATLGSAVSTVATLTVSASGRKLLQFSWAAVKADQVRLRPTVPSTGWMLFRADWVLSPEPPRVAGWDSNWENLGDTYYTGLDLEVNTLNAVKQVEVWVDQTRLTDPATGLSYFPVQANGRRLVHLTLSPGRGHVYRFVAVDANPGLLYGHVWHTDEEPSEQANWNQNFTVGGTLTDKAVKGVLLECDTFGQTKTVDVELDGETITTLAVTHAGRLVKHYAFAPDADRTNIGRVLRLRPTDIFPSRLYSCQWIFDEEPLQLTRWETQRITHGIGGWQVLFGADITYRATSAVTLTVTVYNQTGALVSTREYTLSSTAGAKVQTYVPFQADKGVLFAYLLAVASGETGFSLYREESRVLVLPWGSEAPQWVQPFGDDDLDHVRAMGIASVQAATPSRAQRSGGTASAPGGGIGG